MITWLKKIFRFFFLKRKLRSQLANLSPLEKENFIEENREQKAIRDLISGLKSVRSKEHQIYLDLDTYYDIEHRSHWKRPMFKGEFRIQCCSWIYIEMSALPEKEYRVNFTITQNKKVSLEKEDVSVEEAFASIRKKFHIRNYK